MRIKVGPFPSAGGQEWLQQARAYVVALRRGHSLPFSVPTEVLDVFDRHLDEWAVLARTDPFEWSAEVDVVELRTLMTYWVNLAQYLADHPELQSGGPPEATRFYVDLTNAILGALTAEDEDARVLQERWPAR